MLFMRELANAGVPYEMLDQAQKAAMAHMTAGLACVGIMPKARPPMPTSPKSPGDAEMLEACMTIERRPAPREWPPAPAMPQEAPGAM